MATLPAAPRRLDLNVQWLMSTPTEDRSDRIEAEWRHERPDLDPSSIGVVTRVWELAKILGDRRRKLLAEQDVDPALMDLLGLAAPQWGTALDDHARAHRAGHGVRGRDLARLARAEAAAGYAAPGPSRQVSASKSRNDSMSARCARSKDRSQEPCRRSPSGARPTVASAASPVASSSPTAATTTPVVWRIPDLLVRPRQVGPRQAVGTRGSPPSFDGPRTRPFDHRRSVGGCLPLGRRMAG